MKKFLFVLMGVFAFSGAFAAGENIPTSKSYVDAAVAQKQDKISASIIMPAGYTALEYIESTGTQYIDTGIVAKSGLNTKIKLSIKYATSGCALGTNAGGQFHPAFWYNGNWDSIVGTPDQNGGAVIPDTEYITEFNSNENGFQFYVDGLLKNSGTATHAETGNLWMFRRSGSDSFPMVGKIFYVQIYDNNILVRDFIPARRDSDGVLGMYDTVSNSFFTNSGTGEFVAGPVIIIGNQNQVLTNTGTAGKIGAKGIYDANGAYATQQNNLVDAVTMNAGVQNAIDSEFQCIEWLDPNDHSSDCLLLQLGNKISVPTGYTQLRYIESTGAQWIDTGVVFSSGIGYELEYQPITTNNYVIQAGTTGQVIAQGGNVWEFRFNGSINRRPSPSEIDLTRFVNIKYNIDNKCSVDNRIVYIGDLTLNTGGSIRLFGPNFASSGRMSFFLIYVNGVLVNNLVPARRNSDNVVGMYDTISGRFFTNSGTGGFIPGPVVGAGVGSGVYLPQGN